MAGRHFAPLRLDEAERAELQSLASRRSTAQAVALRARIVLACAEGEQSKIVAARLAHIDQHNVDPKPFRWTKSANQILASIERFCLHNTPVAQS